MQFTSVWYDFKKKDMPSREGIYLIWLEGTQWGKPPLSIGIFRDGRWRSALIDNAGLDLTQFVTHWCDLPPTPR